MSDLENLTEQEKELAKDILMLYGSETAKRKTSIYPTIKRCGCTEEEKEEE